MARGQSYEGGGLAGVVEPGAPVLDVHLLYYLGPGHQEFEMNMT